MLQLVLLERVLMIESLELLQPRDPSSFWKTLV
jgi:hypothetical protein